MIRFKYLALSIAIFILAASCAVEEISMSPEHADYSSRIVHTKSAPVVFSRRDSLQLLYEYQTRGDVFILNHLTGSKGNYSLEISRNDAISLGVAPEVYDFYSSFVEQLNEKQ